MQLLPIATLLLALVATPLSDSQRRTEALRHYDSGVDSMHAEAFERAVREFGAALELDGLLVLAHYNLGQSHMALKQFPEATRAYLGCIATIERLNTLEQGQRVERDRETDDQIREMENLIRRLRSEKSGDPGNKIMMVEGRIRMLEGSRGKGSGRQVRVPAELHLALGSSYFRQGLLDEAEREYGKAVSSDAKLGAAHNNLAVIYMLSGRFQESAEALRKAEKAGFPVSPNLRRDLERRELEDRTKPRP